MLLFCCLANNKVSKNSNGKSQNLVVAIKRLLCCCCFPCCCCYQACLVNGYQALRVSSCCNSVFEFSTLRVLLAKEFGLSHNVDVAVVVQTKFPWPVVDSDSGLSQCDGGLDDDGDGSVVVGVACRKKKNVSCVYKKKHEYLI